ncbi:hypothetical protein AB0M54_44650 [Actinoplanes sp. NPDC051470]|uniref:hypothetical protein n=1 Tax=Actinoplanes sp. NPDC051470 TaxID=3157224 RepID=UPI00343749A7
MDGVGSPAGPPGDRPEQLIGALIPPVIQRPPPAAPLVLTLPPRLRLPTGADAESMLLDMGRLDASGRFSARRLLRALDWPPGHRVDAVVVDDAVLIRSSPTGLQSVGSRGELAVPAAARALAGIADDGHVVLAAAPDHGVLVVHAPAVVTRLLLEHYADLTQEQHRDR